MTKSMIAVVIVTWNSAEVLPGLLTSLDDGIGKLRRQVIVADNASGDDSVAVARQFSPGCRIVQTGRNAGYAAAINAALAAADPYDAALILNPDVRLDPGCVEAMFAQLENDGIGCTGIVVPRLYNGDGALARSLRREPSLLRALGEALLGRRAGRYPRLGETIQDADAYTRPTTADWATGAAILISAACLAACGPWDESFFLYSEETDFALRARDRGYLTRLAPQARAVHLEGRSKVSPRLWALLSVNRVRLYRKRHSAPATVLFWAAVLLREASRAAFGQPRAKRAAAALISPSALRGAPGIHHLAGS